MCRSLLYIFSLVVAAIAVATSTQADVERFKIVSIAHDHDEDGATFNFTLRYETPKEVKFLVAPNAWTLPEETGEVLRDEADAGWTFTFDIPDTEVSPLVHVLVDDRTIYVLTLISPGGPLREDTRISNLVLSTSPESSLTFGPGEEDPELTVTTRIAGPRPIRRDTLFYEVLAISEWRDEMVSYYSAINDSAGLQSAEAPPVRFEVESHEQTGDEIRYGLRLGRGSNDPVGRGVVVVEQSVSFDCTGGCVLHDTTVYSLLSYHSRDRYELSGEDSLVPHPIGRPSRGMFLAYVSSGPGEYTECNEGQPCVIICRFFGSGHPKAMFVADEDAGMHPRNVNAELGSLPSDDVTTWDIQFGHLAVAVMRFESAPLEASGVHVCRAFDSASRAVASHRVTLRAWQIE